MRQSGEYQKYIRLLRPKIIELDFAGTPKEMIFDVVNDEFYKLFIQSPYYMDQANRIIMINTGFPDYAILKNIVLGLYDADIGLLISAYKEGKSIYPGLDWNSFNAENNKKDELEKFVWMLLPDIIWVRNAAE